MNTHECMKKNAPPERILTNCELVSRVELTSNINNEMIALQIMYSLCELSCEIDSLHNVGHMKQKKTYFDLNHLLDLAKAAVFPFIY